MISSVDDYKKKLKLLNQYDKDYYESDSPKITDAEYDEIKKRLIEFEKKNPQYKFVIRSSNFEVTFKFKVNDLLILTLDPSPAKYLCLFLTPHTMYNVECVRQIETCGTTNLPW